MNEKVVNPNDFKVVAFHNLTEFDFTSDMGCMYDGRAINGGSGAPGVQAGETVILPYHVGHQLAVNLAKRVLNTSLPATVDPKGIPTGVPIWSLERLELEKHKFLKELYSEGKPAAQSETDKLMAKVEEYKAMVEKLLAGSKVESITPEQESVVQAMSAPQTAVSESVFSPKVYTDKQEVLAELEKRVIKHDKRKSKDELEKLLV